MDKEIGSELYDDDFLKSLRLEYEIFKYIDINNDCFTHFEYSFDNKNHKLKIITYNRIHQKAFLLKDFEGISRCDVYNKAFDYIKDIIKIEKNYVVDWTDIPSKKQYRSFFRGTSQEEVLSKFYCSIENLKNIVIDSIMSSPIS